MMKNSVLVSVIMPVYNEAATVEAAVERLASVPLRFEIICVDDASTDGTHAVLERLAEEGRIDVFATHERNRGKGAALRTGIERATGAVAVVQDADLEYDPHDLPRLLEPILEDKADAVYGSRFLTGPHRVLYFWHRLGNGMLTLFSNMLTDLNLTDMETCYKMVRTDLLKSLPLRSNRFGFEPELTARLAQARARIYEVPIAYHGRTYAEGKKIGWKDGVAALWHIVRYNLLPPNAEPYRRGASTGGTEQYARAKDTDAQDADATTTAAERRVAGGRTAAEPAAGDRADAQGARHSGSGRAEAADGPVEDDVDGAPSDTEAEEAHIGSSRTESGGGGRAPNTGGPA